MGGHGAQGVMDNWRRSADRLNVDIDSKTYFVRSQSTDVSQEGGELQHGSLFKALVEAQKNYGRLLGVCDTFDDDTSEPIHFTINDDTDTFASYYSENDAISNSGLTYDNVSLTGHFLATSVYPVSRTLMRNSRIDFGAHVGSILGKRMARTKLRDVVLGTGTGQARGFVQDLAQGSSGFTQLPEIEDLETLWESIDSAYRESPNFAIAMNDTMANRYLSLKDNDGKSIWGDNFHDRPVPRFRGTPIIVCNFLDTSEGGVSKKPIVCGDFSHVKVRTVGGTVLERADLLSNSKASIGIFAWTEFDSRYVNPGNDPIKYHATGTLSGDTDYE